MNGSLQVGADRAAEVEGRCSRGSTKTSGYDPHDPGFVGRPMDTLSIIHVALGAAIVLSIGVRAAVAEDYLPRTWGRSRRVMTVTLDVVLIALPVAVAFGPIAGTIAFISFVPVSALIVATLTVERHGSPTSVSDFVPGSSGVVVPFRRRASGKARAVDITLSPR